MRLNYCIFCVLYVEDIQSPYAWQGIQGQNLKGDRHGVFFVCTCLYVCDIQANVQGKIYKLDLKWELKIENFLHILVLVY